MPIGDLPESLSQAILAGIILVGRLGVVNIGMTWDGGEGHTRGPGVVRNDTNFRRNLLGWLETRLAQITFNIA